MNRSWPWLVATGLLLGITVTAVAACSSSSSGNGAVVGGTGSAAGSFPKDKDALTAMLTQGTSSLHSAHITFRVDAQGQTIRAEGDQTLESGKAKDTSITESLPGLGTLKLVIVDGETYVQLPESQRTSAKPWQRVTPTSSNPVIRTLSSSLQGTSSINASDAAATFATATDTLQFQGTQTLGGAKVARYRLRVDVTKLPSTFAQKSALMQTGLTVLPTTLYVDEQGRVRKMDETVTVGGATARTVVTLGKFDAPVSISAPPADQVSED